MAPPMPGMPAFWGVYFNADDDRGFAPASRNSGLTARRERLESFTDIPLDRAATSRRGIGPGRPPGPSSAGAASITLVDSDGNPVLIDLFF